MKSSLLLFLIILFALSVQKSSGWRSQNSTSSLSASFLERQAKKERNRTISLTAGSGGVSSSGSSSNSGRNSNSNSSNNSNSSGNGNGSVDRGGGGGSSGGSGASGATGSSSTNEQLNIGLLAPHTTFGKREYSKAFTSAIVNLQKMRNTTLGFLHEYEFKTTNVLFNMIPLTPSPISK